MFIGRNEVVAKVMFLHMSVILSTGGVSREPPQDQADPPRPDRRPLDQGEPPGTKENPPEPGRTPPGPRRTPQTRENPPRPGRTPPDQGEPPQTRQTPPGKNTAAYGQ